MHLRKLFPAPALHICTLFVVGVAQPLFDQLAQNPEYFVAKKSKELDIILLTLVFSLLIPLLIVSLIKLSELIQPAFGKRMYQLVFHVLLFALIQVAVNRVFSFPGPYLIGLAAMLTIAIAYGYHHFRSIQLFFTYLTPAVFAFPVLFLMSGSVQQFIFAKRAIVKQEKIESSVPIVMLVFDEFPLSSLVNQENQMDGVYFPHFESFAQGATWFRNATTVADMTVQSLPSILSGRYPQADGEERLPVFYDYPQNLFTLLGTTYQMNVIETATQMCPEEICEPLVKNELGPRFVSTLMDLALLYLHLILPEELTHRLPSVADQWGNFFEQGVDRALQFQQFVQSIQRTNRPAFYFIHSQLPHSPYTYLPSGEEQNEELLEHLKKQTQIRWPEKQRFLFLLQRHLLQARYADKLLGDVIQRLKELNLYDRCLIIVTSDHGISFLEGEANRTATAKNYQDILLVPLLIKLPNQTQGSVSDRNVETVDILPTILEILGKQFDWVQGSSLLDISRPERSQKSFHAGHRSEKMYQTFEPHMKVNAETIKGKMELLRSEIVESAGRLSAEFRVLSAE